MSIHFTLPARTLHPFQARRAGFNYQPSPLSPLSKPTNLKLVNPAESNRSHLSNLEKLLQKDPEALSAVHSEAKPVQKGNRNILENLNLGRLWPEMKAAEDMSPRHLNRLKRLLSVTAPQYSPRNGLGGRWREYHGSNDWAGLLDPLDENLRREVVRYGEFIQAAYHAFNSDPATSPAGPPLPRRVALPDKSYRVTRSLYATSSVGLPRWVDDVAPTLDWMTQRSSWIGYVAVCDDKREIQRMGRRDIIIALRGTSTCLEWAENVRAQLVPNDPESNSKVECGFLSLYKTSGSHVPSLSESIVTEIQRLSEVYKGEALSVTVTGHSLGAALALLAANDITTRVPNAPPVAVFSFGGPRVGNKAFAETVKEKKVKVLRIVNSQDVITRVPGVVGAYSHVGTELRVDTRTSPYLKPNADVACCHDLEAYLHLVDGFMGKDCPFRENAKRSLVKLLHDQGSNVNKLYTTKAKNLSYLNLHTRDGLHVSPTCLPSPSSS